MPLGTADSCEFALTESEAREISKGAAKLAFLLPAVDYKRCSLLPRITTPSTNASLGKSLAHLFGLTSPVRGTSESGAHVKAEERQPVPARAKRRAT